MDLEFGVIFRLIVAFSFICSRFGFEVIFISFSVDYSKASLLEPKLAVPFLLLSVTRSCGEMDDTLIMLSYETSRIVSSNTMVFFWSS